MEIMKLESTIESIEREFVKLQEIENAIRSIDAITDIMNRYVRGSFFNIALNISVGIEAGRILANLDSLHDDSTHFDQLNINAAMTHLRSIDINEPTLSKEALRLAKKTLEILLERKKEI